jgi:hypothetical protein
LDSRLRGNDVVRLRGNDVVRLRRNDVVRLRRNDVVRLRGKSFRRMGGMTECGCTNNYPTSFPRRREPKDCRHVVSTHARITIHVVPAQAGTQFPKLTVSAVSSNFGHELGFPPAPE